jgi:hypothetical protein
MQPTNRLLVGPHSCTPPPSFRIQHSTVNELHIWTSAHWIAAHDTKSSSNWSQCSLWQWHFIWKCCGSGKGVWRNRLLWNPFKKTTYVLSGFMSHELIKFNITEIRKNWNVYHASFISNYYKEQSVRLKGSIIFPTEDSFHHQTPWHKLFHVQLIYNCYKTQRIITMPT